MHRILSARFTPLRFVISGGLLLIVDNITLYLLVPIYGFTVARFVAFFLSIMLGYTFSMKFTFFRDVNSVSFVKYNFIAILFSLLAYSLSMFFFYLFELSWFVSLNLASACTAVFSYLVQKRLL